MNSINSIVETANITKDAEVKIFNDGTNAYSFDVAINQSKKDEAGNWVDEAFFIKVKFFSKSDYYADKLVKGARVVILGSLVQEQWKDKNDETVKRLVIKANQIEVLQKNAKTTTKDIKGGDKPKLEEDIPF